MWAFLCYTLADGLFDLTHIAGGIGKFSGAEPG
jgi:hypothetical protein